MITAPYNFVPLNQEIFYPDWSNDISHDVPFEDAESGSIDISITAKSPIFIRDHENPEKFCQHNGQYYIPGSSIKGMIRNVLEIMSFAKINQDMVDDKTYAIRDLRNRDLYMSKMKPQNIYCGWLRKDGYNYVVEDCGIPGRIKQDDINEDFAQYFKASYNQNGKFKNKPQFKTAKYKYSLIKEPLTQMFDYVKKDNLREVYKKGTSKKGTLVLTGQASARKDKGKFDAKIYEFIFFDSKRTLPLSNEVFENFKFAYFDGRKTEPKESPDWTYWKTKLKKGKKIPIFFQKKDGLIQHIGLSYLYKLPYTNSVYDGIPQEHYDDKLDLAQTIFGYTNKDDVALKGRVQFSHFKAVSNIKELKSRTEILGTPRASYYPMYIYQNGKIYSTYMNDSFLLAGRKRYPIHKDSKPVKTTNTGNQNVGTTFIPLKEGVIFKGKLRYHNLKKEEVGALLSALTFHNTPDIYHNIGMAKSLGYGKIKITIDNKNTIPYLQKFENLMQSNIKNWANSNQIIELFTMATEQENSGNSLLKYMELPDFAQVKKSNEFLRYYSKLDNIKTKSISLLNNTNNNQTISKTKMRKALTESWQRVFKIFYHPNQIKEFIQGEFKTTPQEQAQVYIKLKSNKKFQTIIQLIYDFNNEKLNSNEIQKLYDMIINLK